MAKGRNLQGDIRLWEQLTEQFLAEVCQKHRYDTKDMELFRKVAADMRICMKGQEGFCCSYPSEETIAKEAGKETVNVFATVVMTLGTGIDMLSERYYRTERLLESYMLESISAELLMLGYQQLNGWIGREMGWHAVKMHFFGSSERLLLNQLPEVLEQLGQKKVTCTKDYCLRPQKSVVYQVELSRESDRGCADICDICNQREMCSIRIQEGTTQPV